MSSIRGRIYIHRNKLNDKCYVGQTTKKFAEHRWGKNGKEYHTSKKFYNAIKLYGWNNFEHIILPTIYTTQQDLDQAEIDMIKELDSCDNGYNLTYGGMYPKISQETKRRMSEASSGRGYRKVYQYDLQGNFIKEWESIKNVAETFKTNHTNIIDVCKGRSKTSNGYIWSYDKKNITPYKHGNQVKSILQLKQNGDVLAKHNSYNEAARFIGVKSSSNIIKAIKQDKLYRGYIWKEE